MFVSNNRAFFSQVKCQKVSKYYENDFGKQLIAMYKLPNILRSKGNQKKKFG